MFKNCWMWVAAMDETWMASFTDGAGEHVIKTLIKR